MKATQPIPTETVIATAKRVCPDISDRALEALVEFSEIDQTYQSLDEASSRINKIIEKREPTLSMRELMQIALVAGELNGMAEAKS